MQREADQRNVLTREELTNVKRTWDQESFARSNDCPALPQQQFVLFDERMMWPGSEGWPR